MQHSPRKVLAKMSELAALVGGVLIGYLFTKQGKVPVYVPSSTTYQQLSQPSAIQVNFPSPIITKLAGWSTFSAKKVVIQSASQLQALLPPSLDCKQVQVRAGQSNSSTMWIGDSTVAIDNGYPLNANDALSIPVSSEAQPYVVDSSAGDKVYFAVVL